MATEADRNSQTNWTIASGSLPNCLTFQSSLSFSDDDDESTTSTSKPLPLLLHSPSPDSPPCEITINFAEKHELRQVYVRSTARVYEIYCAPDSLSNNEYLYTVRCAVATRDGEVLRSPGIHEIASSPDKDSGDENVKSEDDWVEVKVPSQTKPYIDSTNTDQDLFEATAEINDSNPCISVTLRLLSLQSKGCICVDEIYVFGDPVDSESQESHNEHSSGSSLMAMFLPTLMQMSKTTDLSHLNAVRKEKQFVSEDDLKENPHPSDSVIENQLKGKACITDPHEEKLKEMKGGLVGPSQADTLSKVAKMESNRAAVPSQATQMDSNCSAIPSKIAEMENNHCAVPSQVPTNQGLFSGGNVERVLVQLMSRMDRIKEICLGFQEKMVMPMNSIEARLQQVEQQLDTLSKNFQNSALPSGYRISAPDASCIESDANSCENCVDYTVTREMDSDKKYLHTEILNAAPHDTSDSENQNTTQLLPGIVFTAPEFTEGEDEEDNASEQEISSSNDKEKQSIDDALSSALANFLLSSLPPESSKYTESLSFKAPEFSNEDDDDHESNNETVKNDPVHLTDREKYSHIQVLDSPNNSLESAEKENNDSNDKNSEKTAQEAEQCDKFCSARGDQDEVCVKDSALAEHNLRTDVNDNVEEDKNEKIGGLESDSSNISNISNELVDNQTPSDHSITQEGPSARTELTVATEAPKKTFRESIIESVLGFSLASSAVDFEIPVLDVKFISQRSPITMGFLEALLVETPDSSPGDPSVKESSEDLSVKEQLNANGDLSVEEHSNLISVDDGEPVNQASNSGFVLGEVLCTSISAPVNIMETRQKKNLFFTRCLVKDKVCSLVIDRKYWINMASTTMVEKLKLPVLEHPQPYILYSLDDPEFKDMGDIMVTKQARVSFKIGEYEDEVICDVVPTETRDLLLGRPWRHERHAKHDSYTNKYKFLFKNRAITLVPLDPKKVTCMMREKNESFVTKIEEKNDKNAREIERKESDVKEVEESCERKEQGKENNESYVDKDERALKGSGGKNQIWKRRRRGEEKNIVR